jgi:non-specific serine/threonine protein kinase
VLAVVQGDVRPARAWLGQSLAFYRAAGDRLGTIIALRALGLLAEQEDDFAHASALHEEALAESRRLDDPAIRSVYVGGSLGYLGSVDYALGELDLAAARLDEARAEAGFSGYQWGVAFATTGLGYVAAAVGDDRRALELLRESLERFAEQGDRRLVAVALDGVASLAAGWGEAERAARLFGAAAEVREAGGLTSEPVYRADRERGVAKARATLGEAGFAAAWAAGRARPLAEAIAEAGDLTPPAAPPRTPSVAPNPYDLTRRERDVLRLLIEGRTDKEIGQALHITRRTAMTHVSNILHKLGVESRTAAAAAAVRAGLD